jgi:hypothetical protein
MDSRSECIDTELFISVIENKNVIWNTQTAEYIVRNAKSKAWKNISKIFYEHFDDKPTAEKNNIGKYTVHKLYLLLILFYIYHHFYNFIYVL